jgi:hypothetical protein
LVPRHIAQAHCLLLDCGGSLRPVSTTTRHWDDIHTVVHFLFLSSYATYMQPFLFLAQPAPLS